METRQVKTVVMILAVCVLGMSTVTLAAAVRGVGLCHPYDTCTRSLAEDDIMHDTQLCSCDTSCSLYGDCCRDAEAYVTEEQVTNKDHFACVDVRSAGNVYMRSHCAPDWGDDGDENAVASLCALGNPGALSDRQDPLLDMPVTSFASLITYTNAYCALCNREDSGMLLRWATKVECSTLNKTLGNKTQEFIEKNLVYNEVRGSWGLDLEGEEGVPPEFHTCYIDPAMPDLVAPLVRSCVDSVSSCAPDYPDGDVVELCHSYTSVVYHANKPYRNVHCVECNRIEGPLSCFEIPTRLHPEPTAFAILLDFGGLHAGNIVGSSCGSGQIWDPFFKRCRSVFCRNPRQKFVAGRCVTVGSTRSSTDSPTPSTDGPSPLSSTPEATTGQPFSSTTKKQIKKSRIIDTFSSSAPVPQETPTPSYSTVVVTTPHPSESTTDTTDTSHLANCARLHVLEDEIVRRKTGFIFIPGYSENLEPGQYENHTKGEGGILVCAFDVLPDGGKFSTIMAWLTLVCLGISCICLVLHLIAFALTPSPKNLSEKNLASLCLALLVAYTTFLAGQWSAPGSTGCFAAAGVMYFFFLASFCWMNVLAFDTRRMLRTTTQELRVSTGRQWKKFAMYSLYGWVLPGVALLVLIVIDLERPYWVHWSYLPMMGETHCWIGQRKALLVFFATPLGLIMAANLFYFGSSARIIHTSLRSRSQVTSTTSTSKSLEKEHVLHFALHVRLALMMGVIWISGIVAGCLNYTPIWYIFVVLTCLQGLFIFVVFTRKERISPKGLLNAMKKIYSQGFRSRVS
ncbi:uncharacterized protein LOC143017727 [Oratosquilla oratoria]|uniref:uncharacterized protein LOC143017727 n=1 Tax=Oratosquilla oratoria TaxID=337810 RepID=UPI003F775A98